MYRIIYKRCEQNGTNHLVGECDSETECAVMRITDSMHEIWRRKDEITAVKYKRNIPFTEA